MPTDVPLISEQQFRRLSALAGLLVILIATTALSGWVLDQPLLASFIPDRVTMKVNTAIALILAGVSLTLREWGVWLRLSRSLSVLVGVIGLLTLMEYLGLRDIGIDQWLFREAPSATETLSPNRMAPASAILFMFLGSALFLDNRHTRNQSLIAGVVCAGLPVVILPGLAYLFDVHSDYGLGRYLQIAVPTLLAFLLLMAGLLLAQPDHGVVKILNCNSSQGMILRHALPVALAAPVGLESFRLLAVRSHWLAPDFGSPFITGSYIVIFVVLAFRIGGLVGRREEALAASNLRISTLLEESHTIRAALAGSIAQYRQTLDELRQTETRFRQIFEHSPLGIAVLDTHLDRFTALNPSFCAMMARDAGELLANNWQLITHPEDLEASINFVSRLKHGEVITARIEKRYLRGDGRTMWGNLYVARLPNPKTGTPEHLAIVEDITERKQLEYSLIRLSLAVEQSPGTIVVTDTDANIVYANPAFTHTTGYSLEESIGQNPRILHSGKTPPEVFRDMWSHLADGEIWTGELINRRKDRSEYTESAIISPIHDKLGTLIGYLAIKEDITAHKALLREREQLVRDLGERLNELGHQEKVLRESERRFRTMIEQTVVGIYIQREGIILYANPRLASVLGVEANGMIGHDLMEFTPNDPANRQNILRAREQIHHSKEVVTGVVPAIRADGTRIELALTAKEIIWDDGMPATIVIAEDITERKRADERIAEYVTRLEDSLLATMKAVSTMVELRDPYTAGHERRVGMIAGDIGRELGWSEERCRMLEMTGLVHDIGKIAVPSEILTKPSRLNPLEMQLVKGHAEAGYQILKDVPFDTPVAEAIRQHHERLDGSGYPRGLRGDDILPEARILAVADVIESMSSHRPYRPALGMDAALAEIERGRGTHFDPEVVDAMVRLVRVKGYALPQ